MFQTTANRIAEQQQRIKEEQEKLEKYQQAIEAASYVLPEIISQLKNVHERLLPYPEEHEQVLGFLLEAMGVSYEVVQQASKDEDSDEDSDEEARNPVQILIGTNKRVGYINSGLTGFELYIGFEKKQSKTPGVTASTWRKFLDESYAEIKCSIVKNWQGNSIDPIAYPWLVQALGGTYEVGNEISKLDFNLMPEEAIVAESQQSKPVEKEAQSKGINNTPINNAEEKFLTEASEIATPAVAAPTFAPTSRDLEIIEQTRQQLGIASVNEQNPVVGFVSVSSEPVLMAANGASLTISNETGDEEDTFLPF